MIGQFGVGFYSAFMVADQITLVTRRAGDESSTKWQSTGNGQDSVSESERAAHGTSITLKPSVLTRKMVSKISRTTGCWRALLNVIPTSSPIQ
jgi:HSP90 family molecular chaperone